MGAGSNQATIVPDAGRGRPLTGARIKHLPTVDVAPACQVAPSRGRGSKQSPNSTTPFRAASPPHGGADSNTAQAPDDEVRSPPHGGADRNVTTATLRRRQVAPSRGADRNCPAPGAIGRPGRPLTGARIETADLTAGSRHRSPPHGGADRNHAEPAARRAAPRSPPHGGADRNVDVLGCGSELAGRPLTGARIETPTRRASRFARMSPPHGGADRNSPVDDSCRSAGSPPHGGADRNSTMPPAERRSVAPSRGRGSKRPADAARL